MAQAFLKPKSMNMGWATSELQVDSQQLADGTYEYFQWPGKWTDSLEAVPRELRDVTDNEFAGGLSLEMHGWSYHIN
jgi:hypothetical protein